MFEDNILFEVKLLLVEDEDYRIFIVFNCFDIVEVCYYVLLDNLLIEVFNYLFWVNKYFGKFKIWRCLKRIIIEKGEDSFVSVYFGCEGEENMNGRGKVNILFINFGKCFGL